MSADFGAPDCGCLAKRLGFVRTLPGKRRLAAAKMPVSSRWTIDGPSQVQTLDDAARRELKHGANQIGHLFVRDRTGVEGVDHNRDRLGYSDRVGELHLGAAGESGRDQILGHVAGHVAGRAVHLGRILARKRSAAMAAVTRVSIYDKFFAGESRIAPPASHPPNARWDA